MSDLACLIKRRESWVNFKENWLPEETVKKVINELNNMIVKEFQKVNR